MALIIIDGIEMPQPNTYSIPMDDMETSDSAYSESGTYVRNRVRQGICKLDLSWRLSGTQAAALLLAIKPATVRVSYYDPRKGGMTETTMYVDSRSCAIVSLGESTRPEDIIWDISFSLIEY